MSGLKKDQLFLLPYITALHPNPILFLSADVATQKERRGQLWGQLSSPCGGDSCGGLLWLREVCTWE